MRHKATDQRVYPSYTSLDLLFEAQAIGVSDYTSSQLTDTLAITCSEAFSNLSTSFPFISSTESDVPRARGSWRLALLGDSLAPTDRNILLVRGSQRRTQTVHLHKYVTHVTHLAHPTLPTSNGRPCVYTSFSHRNKPTLPRAMVLRIFVARPNAHSDQSKPQLQDA